MKKVILFTLFAITMTGCATFQPAENVQALREVNAAKVEVMLNYELKAKADIRAIEAAERVKVSEEKFEQAKRKFNEINK